MSLDELAEERLVRLTIDGLVTVSLAADKISEPISKFTDEERKYARDFLSEYQRALHLGVPTGNLRESFVYVSNIVTRKAKSPVSELYALLSLMCVSGSVFSGVMVGTEIYRGNDENAALWVASAVLGLVGVGVSSVLQYRADLKAKSNMARDTARVCDAPDTVWAEALSRIYDDKKHAGDFYD